MSASGQKPQPTSPKPPAPVIVQAPPPPPPTPAVQDAIDAQLLAAATLAEKSMGQTAAQEAKDFAQASLFLSQAVVTLHPNPPQPVTGRVPGGPGPTGPARTDSIPKPPLPSVRDSNKDGVLNQP